MGECKVLCRCGRIKIILKRLRSVLHALGVGVRPRRRRPELVLHDHDSPMARWCGPINCTICNWYGHSCTIIGIHRRNSNGRWSYSCPHRLSRCRRNPLRSHQSLHPHFRFKLGKFPACKSAGIARIVDDPDPHVASLRLFDEGPKEFEVIRREIGERHSVPSLYGHGLVPERLHRIEIATNHRLIHWAIQTVVRLRPVLRRRRRPSLCNLLCRQHLNLLPRLLRHRASRNNCPQIPAINLFISNSQVPRFAAKPATAFIQGLAVI